MKLLILFSLICFDLSFLSAMEKPETPKPKQPLLISELEKLINEGAKTLENKQKMRELLRDAQKGNLDAQINLAYALFAQGEFKQALIWLKKAQEQGYESPHLFIALYFNLNDINHAKEFAEKAISQHSDNPDGYLLLGNIKIVDGDQASALAFYNKGIQLGSISGHYDRALLYMDQNKNDLAKKDFQELIDKNNKMKDIAQGFLYYLDNDFRNAFYVFSTHKFLPGLFLVYEKENNVAAKNALEQIIKKLNPNAGSDAYHFALIALKEKHIEKAIEYFKKSLQYPNHFWQEPSYPGKAAYNLYKLYRNSNPDEAYRYLEEAIKFHNADALATMEQQVSEINPDIVPEARIQASPGFTPATLKKRLQQMIEPLAMPKTKKEIARLTKSAEAGNVESQVSLVRALVNLEPEKALEWVKKAEAQNYQFKPALLAELYFGLNDIETAQKFANQAAEQHDPHGFRILAQISLIKENLEKAFEWYDKAIHAGEPEALYQRALIYINQNKFDLAKKDLQELIDQGDRFATEAKGHLEFLNGNFQKAIELFKKAKDQLHMAIAYQELAKPSITSTTLREQYKNRAQELFQQVAQEEACGVGYFHLGLIALKENQREKAIENFKQALKRPTCFWQEASYPGEALYNLFRLYKNENPDEAQNYLKRAEKLGNTRAEVTLGLQYYNNRDLPENERINLAQIYLQRAADKGASDAKYNLALIAEYQEDYARAKELFGQLVKEQYRDSAQRLKEIIKKQLEALKK